MTTEQLIDLFQSLAIIMLALSDVIKRRWTMAEYVVEEPSSQSASWRVRERIVRCRDCKHAQVRHPLNPITGIPAGIDDWRCDYFWNIDELPEVEPDGFCAWGACKEAHDG